MRRAVRERGPHIHGLDYGLGYGLVFESTYKHARSGPEMGQKTIGLGYCLAGIADALPATLSGCLFSASLSWPSRKTSGASFGLGPVSFRRERGGLPNRSHAADGRLSLLGAKARSTNFTGARVGPQDLEYIHSLTRTL